MKEPERYPHDVYTWQNGMVMVFDQFGDQMPELQGPREEVWEKIKARAREDTKFMAGNWRMRTVNTERDASSP